MSSSAPSSAQRIVVVDSSVAFKWLNADDETRVAEALELLQQHQSGGVLLVVPAHLPAEVVNGLRYSGLDAADVARAAAALCAAELVTMPLTSELLGLAVELAFTHSLTVHDALFPALAILLEAELVTADRAQTRATECPVHLLA